MAFIEGVSPPARVGVGSSGGVPADRDGEGDDGLEEPWNAREGYIDLDGGRDRAARLEARLRRADDRRHRES